MASSVVKSVPIPDVEVSFNLLKNLKKIGSGGCADVYIATHTGWGCDVAYKKYKVDLFDLEAAEQDRAKYVSLCRGICNIQFLSVYDSRI